MTDGTTLQGLFDLYDLPTGRRAYAYGVMLDGAKKRDDGVMVALLTEAVAANEKARATEKAWDTTQSTATTNVSGTRVRLIDARIDKTVTRLRDAAADQLEALDPDEEEERMLLTDFLDTHFPKGAQAYTKIGYEEEFQAVTKLMSDIRSGSVAVVQMLGLELMLKQLDKLMPKYKAAIDESNEVAGTTWKDVTLSRDVAQEAMLAVVGFVASRHWKAEDIKTRQMILGPIFAQNTKVGDAFRQRREIPDVDPSTGVEVALPPAVAVPGLTAGGATSGAPAGASVGSGPVGTANTD